MTENTQTEQRQEPSVPGTKSTEGDNLVKTSENKPERDEKGRLLPGNTANPNGRPPGFSLLAMLKAKLQDVQPSLKKSYAELIINSMINKAPVEKDAVTLKLIWNYVEGMPRQNIGLDGGSDGAPIQTQVSGLEKLTDKQLDEYARTLESKIRAYKIDAGNGKEVIGKPAEVCNPAPEATGSQPSAENAPGVVLGQPNGQN